MDLGKECIVNGTSDVQHECPGAISFCLQVQDEGPDPKPRVLDTDGSLAAEINAGPKAIDSLYDTQAYVPVG